MKYRPLGWLSMALALGCAPQAVDRTIDAGNRAMGRDTGVEAARRPDLPGPGDAATAQVNPPPPPDAAAEPDAGAQADLPPAPEDTAPARPDFSTAMAASCVGDSPWQSGKQYEAGDTVIHGEPRRKFECRPWPNTPWCWLPDYEPGKNLFYDDAWIDQGACP
jgi:hypothetical protein